MTVRPVICWLRLDLRLADNPALLAATESGAPVIPVFTWSPDDEAPWAPGGASRWWLHQSLTALDASLRDRGSRLIVRQGSAVRELLSVARAVGATHVVWAQRYEPIVIAGDAKIEAALVKAGLGVVRTPGNLLFEPDDVRTQAGQPFQVYLKQKVLEPLGMSDTDFHVPADKHDRFTANYQAGPGGKLQVAVVCDATGIRDRAGELGEGRRDFFSRFDVELIGVELHPVGVAEGLAGLEAEHQLMRMRVLFFQVMAVISACHGDVQLFVDFDQAGIGDPLVLETVGLHFEVEVFFPENLLKFTRHGHRAGHIFLADEIGRAHV